jgi:hypothetical protein
MDWTQRLAMRFDDKQLLAESAQQDVDVSDGEVVVELRDESPAQLTSGVRPGKRCECGEGFVIQVHRCDGSRQKSRTAFQRAAQAGLRVALPGDHRCIPCYTTSKMADSFFAATVLPLAIVPSAQ